MYDIRNSIVVADGLWKYPSVIAYQMSSTACQCPLGWVEYTGAHHGRLYMYSTKGSLVILLNIVVIYCERELRQEDFFFCLTNT